MKIDTFGSGATAEGQFRLSLGNMRSGSVEFLVSPTLDWYQRVAAEHVVPRDHAAYHCIEWRPRVRRAVDEALKAARARDGVEMGAAPQITTAVRHDGGLVVLVVDPDRQLLLLLPPALTSVRACGRCPGCKSRPRKVAPKASPAAEKAAPHGRMA
jgi:hypothetical protein